VAPEVVAGKGRQPVVMLPEPTHWFTVAVVVAGTLPVYSFVTATLQRSVPPPPLVELLHWVTAVTGAVRLWVVVVQAACGAPAAPWHSRTVTVADPPPAVKWLTTVTWQIRPRPGVSSRPLLQVGVGAIAAAPRSRGGDESR